MSKDRNDKTLSRFKTNFNTALNRFGLEKQRACAQLFVFILLELHDAAMHPRARPLFCCADRIESILRAEITP